MIGLDTNILVRYIVQDDAVQAASATRFVEKHCTHDQPGRVNSVVLCELIWVLARAYGYDRATQAGVLRRLLNAADLEVESPEATRQALADFEAGDADFSDYLIARLNTQAGALFTATLDQRAGKHPLFRLIK